MSDQATQPDAPVTEPTVSPQELAAMQATLDRREAQTKPAGTPAGTPAPPAAPAAMDFTKPFQELGGRLEGLPNQMAEALGPLIAQQVQMALQQQLEGLTPMMEFTRALMSEYGVSGNGNAGNGESAAPAQARSSETGPAPYEQKFSEMQQRLEAESAQNRFLTDLNQMMSDHMASQMQAMQQSGDLRSFVPPPSKAAIAAILRDPSRPADRLTGEAVFRDALALEQGNRQREQQIRQEERKRYAEELRRMGQQRIEEMPDFSADSPMTQALLDAPFDPSQPAHENPATRAAIEALADQYFSGGGQMSQAATTAQRSFMPPYNAFAGVARRKTG